MARNFHGTDFHSFYGFEFTYKDFTCKILSYVKLKKNVLHFFSQETLVQSYSRKFWSTKISCHTLHSLIPRPQQEPVVWE